MLSPVSINGLTRQGERTPGELARASLNVEPCEH